MHTLLKITSLFISAGFVILVYHLFALAYTHGGQVTIDINRFGEATVELYVLAALAPLLLVGWLLILRKISRG